jgi:transmembrane 9 superfamily protein 2/4
VGWKKLAGDVFRKPNATMLLSLFLGNGIHLWVMGLVILLSSMVGIAMPDHFGNIVAVLFIVYLLSNSIVGYASSRLYKLLAGSNWLT